MAESEDGIIATDDFIAVIDGSTSKTNLCLHPGTTNGRYCMTLIKQYISQAGSGYVVRKLLPRSHRFREKPL